MAKIRIQAHCQDRCGLHLIDDPKHPRNTEHIGYVPEGLGIGGGDYISMEIDLETGQIVGWKKPLDTTITEVFEPQSEEELNNGHWGLYPDQMGR